MDLVLVGAGSVVVGVVSAGGVDVGVVVVESGVVDVSVVVVEPGAVLVVEVASGVVLSSTTGPCSPASRTSPSASAGALLGSASGR